MNSSNPVIKSAFQYHQHTSYHRRQLTGHYLDWENQPALYKSYPEIEPVLLPRRFQIPGQRLYSLLKKAPLNNTARIITLADISLIFYLTYSLSARTRHSGGDFYYRNVASAGALYPTEIYILLRGVQDLKDGLYYFSIAHHGLFQLRKGDLSGSVVSLSKPISKEAPLLTFFFSVIFFRSSWKYRERSYRYHLLDTGHLIENLLLALKALRFPSVLRYNYNDNELNRLLGLHDGKEVCLATCTVAGPHSHHEEKTQEIYELPELFKRASIMAEKETDYPAILQIHNAGNTPMSGPKAKSHMLRELGIEPGQWMRIITPEPWPESLSYSEAVVKRRSRRNFVHKTISRSHLMSLIDCICVDISKTDGDSIGQNSIVCTGVLIGNAEKVEPGFYLLDTSSSSMGMVAPGFFMDSMARICLDQNWLAGAAAHFLLMTNLNIVDNVWGARGYRHAMMTAGRLGERLYLTATALGLGCCGIGAFYDTEAVDLLRLNRNSRLLYLVAIGSVKT